MTRKQARKNDLETENGPDKTRPLKLRLMQLLDLLPQCDWSVSKAAIQLGYSETYAYHRLPAILREDVKFCDAVEIKRQEFIAATGWDEKKWRQECVGQFERAKIDKDWPAICALLRMLGNNTGALQTNLLRIPPGQGQTLAIVVFGQPEEEPVKQVECKVVEMLPAGAEQEA